MTVIAELVDAYERTLDQLCAAFSDPSSIHLTEIHREMERLGKISAKKAFVDASFAHVCVRENAGRLVGGNWASDYLEKALDISRAEAFRRIDRAKGLFAPVPPEDSTESAAPVGDADSCGEATPPLFPPSRDKGKKTRSDSQEVSAEKQAIINQELRRLSKARRRGTRRHLFPRHGTGENPPDR